MYTLTDTDIDKMSEEVAACLAEFRIQKHDRIRIRLSVEEILLKYRERFGQETEAELLHEKHFGILKLRLKLHCDRSDLTDVLSEEDVLFQRLSESPGCVPVWSYKNRCNEIHYSLRAGSRLPSWAGIVITAAAGILAGLAARAMPEKLYRSLTEKLLDPVSSAVMGFFAAIAGVMMAISVIAGIVGMGSVSTMNRIGKKLFGHIVLWLVILALLIFAAAPFVFSIGRSTGAGFDFESIWNMLLGMIPSGFLEPFLTGNTMQIVFLAVFTGFIILRLAGKSPRLADAVQNINLLVQEMVVIITKALPVIVFISMFELIGNKNGPALGDVYKYPLYHTVLCCFWLFSVIARVCITKKVSVSVLLKKLIPSFLIAFSTASSSASLYETMKACDKKYGIEKQLVHVGIPISNIFNKPISLIERMTALLCMAELFGVDISLSTLAAMVITSFAYAMSAPTVPGGGISSFTLMALQFGIPIEAVSIIISLDVIIDRITTSAQVAVGQLELIQVADRLNKLDSAVLRSAQT